jgi:hypothetical protein
LKSLKHWGFKVIWLEGLNVAEEQITTRQLAGQLLSVREESGLHLIELLAPGREPFRAWSSNVATNAAWYRDRAVAQLEAVISHALALAAQGKVRVEGGGDANVPVV